MLHIAHLPAAHAGLFLLQGGCCPLSGMLQPHWPHTHLLSGSRSQCHLCAWQNSKTAPPPFHVLIDLKIAFLLTISVFPACCVCVCVCAHTRTCARGVWGVFRVFLIGRHTHLPAAVRELGRKAEPSASGKIPHPREGPRAAAIASSVQ